MSKSKTVELRPSQAKEKPTKAVKFLRGCLTVVKLLSSVLRALNELWDAISSFF
jgi:hypothetical protein